MKNKKQKRTKRQIAELTLDLARVIQNHNIALESNTPVHILANVMVVALLSAENAINDREAYYNQLKEHYN